MKSWIIWFVVGLVMLMLAGVGGDMLFYPHPVDFSFRVFSNYSIAVLLLVAALATAVEEDK